MPRRASPGEATARASTRRRSSPCIPSPRGTQNSAGSSGRLSAPGRATSATATNWASRSSSRSDVRLSSYGLGASVPLADMLSGELGAEAGIDGFAFEIEGGGQISTSLPTLRGRDYRAGLAWSAPVPGTPYVSVAYKQLTGDGPEGAQVEARGSASVEGFLDPRLTLEGNAEATFGLGGYGHDSWQLGGGLHFAPGGSGRGLDLDLDARVMSPADGGEAGEIGVRGEAGYGLPERVPARDRAALPWRDPVSGQRFPAPRRGARPARHADVTAIVGILRPFARSLARGRAHASPPLLTLCGGDYSLERLATKSSSRSSDAARSGAKSFSIHQSSTVRSSSPTSGPSSGTPRASTSAPVTGSIRRCFPTLGSLQHCLRQATSLSSLHLRGPR